MTPSDGSSDRLPTGEAPPSVDEQFSPQPWNLPNLLSAIRLAGAFVVLGLTWAEAERLLLPVIAVLLVTDWFDGLLAVRWHQRTVVGAQLDSLADVSFYSAVLLALGWFQSDVVWSEWPWLLPGMVVYVVNALVGLARFRRFPTYHTRAAKLGWILAVLAILGVLVAGKGWPLRWAGVWVLGTNLEALLITCLLRRPAVDVPSLGAALERRRHEAPNAE